MKVKKVQVDISHALAVDISNVLHISFNTWHGCVCECVCVCVCVCGWVGVCLGGSVWLCVSVSLYVYVSMYVCVGVLVFKKPVCKKLDSPMSKN